jgi:CRP-like cAMP-binding protein
VLLARLPVRDFDAVMASSRLTMLRRGRELYTTDAPVDAVYFPLDCIVCLLVSPTAVEPAVEMAIIGNEGVVGAPAILDGGSSVGTYMVQIAGAAMEVSLDAFRELARRHPSLDSSLRRYIYLFLRQVLQAAACNRLHSVEERCARWLLVMHDRIARSTFEVTQDFIANMLGVRRATVNLAFGKLRESGSIRYIRGRITIVDREGLVSVSCGCYTWSATK